ncbi:MAG: hypothetical protein HY460_01010, partial [Parcubacteria group bacterium]|nr:hypothetical protein [Parcubacteria group bacterium]
RVVYLAKTIAPKGTVIPIVEDVAAQKWLYQELRRAKLLAEAFKIHGVAKDVRLKTAGTVMEIGQAYFPIHGSKDLRAQILGFGAERHDDLADAFSSVIVRIIEQESTEPGMIVYMRERVENRKKNPLAPGSLAGWEHMSETGQYLPQDLWRNG